MEWLRMFLPSGNCTRIDDTEVLRRAVGPDAIVLTADHDFADLVIAQGAECEGVILLRTHPIRAHVDAIVAAIERPADALPGSFAVL